MMTLDKYINHTILLINALKEQNKIVKKEMQNLMGNKVFVTNKSFQKAYYAYTIYTKLFTQFEKSFMFLINNKSLNKRMLAKVYNNYFVRCVLYFKDTYEFAKLARAELIVEGKVFRVLFQNMKCELNYLNEIDNDVKKASINLY